MRAADGVTFEAPTGSRPSDAELGLPDGLPTASANIYCDGHLDAALAEVIVPIWRRARDKSADRVALWLMRYSRGGEHLKIRLHGPPEFTTSITAEFEEAAEQFFERMPPSDPERTRRTNDQIPAIDAEDAVAEPHPDRTLLWTDYRCPPGHMGPAPLSSFPGFARSYTAALAAATDIVLERTESAGAEPLGSNTRVSLFASFLLTLAAVPGLNGSEALAHHRDWLLAGAKSDAASALSFMNKRMSAQTGQLDALRLRWQAVTQGQLIPGFAGFTRALEDHVAFCLEALGASEIAQLDEAEARQVFGAVARILHNVANLLAIDLSNEIYFCHLLHSAGSLPST